VISPVVARSGALAAAQKAGVEVAPAVTIDELDELRSLVHDVWGPEIVPPRNLLRGMAIGGACMLIARRDGRPVAFAMGFLGWEGGVHLHSHQVGVHESMRGSGVGMALKLAQRADCLEHGIAEMRWTFDPVLRTNAHFNLVRLGATAVAFLPHCYGDRRDAFNTGDTTDRVEVSWRLDAPVGGALVQPADGDEVLALPADYHSLRSTDPAAAAEVRRTVGEGLARAFASGRRVTGLGDQGYVVAP
jgi:predicted GNAT superfamily acetyltransferase